MQLIYGRQLRSSADRTHARAVQLLTTREYCLSKEKEPRSSLEINKGRSWAVECGKV